MTSQPQPAPGSASQYLRPLRDIAAYALVAAPAAMLFVAIIRLIPSGDGFANPFPGKSGPTAWMPPILPALEGGLLWWFDGKRDSVMACVVFRRSRSLCNA